MNLELLTGVRNESRALSPEIREYYRDRERKKQREREGWMK